MSVHATKNEKSFVSGSIPKAMLAFSWPFALGILVQNLYGAVDLFVVGHYASTVDVSAVTIGSQLMTLLTQLIIGFATGITILVGRYFGAGDERRLARVVGVSVVLFGAAAAALSALYLGFHTHLSAVMQTPAEALTETNQYLFYCSLGVVFIVGFNVVSSILTGLGDSRTPFLFIMIACLINVALDVILVKYFHMGARGAAIATTAAQAGSFVFSLAFLHYKGLGFGISKSDLRLDREQAWGIARIGGPVALQNVLVGASFLFVTAIINMMGLVASAAVGVVEKLITFLFVPATAMGTAVGTASAQNIGADRMDRAQNAMWWGIGLALVPGAVIAVCCQFFGGGMAGILSGDAKVVALAAEYLSSYVWDILLVSFVFCMNGFFNSCGKSWFSLAHSLATTFAVRVPVAFILSRMDGASLFRIGWAAPASTFVSLIMCVVFLKHMGQGSMLPKAASPKGRLARQPLVATVSKGHRS